MESSDSHDMVELAAYWTRAQPLVGGFVSSMVPNFHDAEDILQHVAMVLARKFGDYDRDRSFVHWAMGVARYEILAYYRRQGQEKHLFDAELVEQIGQTYVEMGPRLGPIQEALRRCMRKVKDRDRQVMEMWYVDQQSPDEIVRCLGIARSTLYVILHRVRHALKLCIRRQLALMKEMG